MEQGTQITLRDTRDHTIFAGTLAKLILAGDVPSDEDIAEFYKLQPKDTQYPHAKMAVGYDRIVIRRGDPMDKSYYIVPSYSFYQPV